MNGLFPILVTDSMDESDVTRCTICISTIHAIKLNISPRNAVKKILKEVIL